MTRAGAVVRVAGAVAAVGAACVAYGVVVERHRFVVRRFTLPILPAGSPTVRVLHLADVHLLARQRRKLRFLASLQGIEPDLVVNTGDNVSEAAAIEPFFAALGRLLDKPGVFVFGSNDYAAPGFTNPLSYLVGGTRSARRERPLLPTEDLRSGFADAGWVDLNNRRTTLDVRGVRLDVRGTDDAHHRLEDLSVAQGPVDPAAALTIGVTHAPYLRVLDAFVSSGVGLVIAGHTHGGQVCVPGHGALVTNCDLDAERAKGISTHLADGRIAVMHVSAGVGSSPFAPYRFACRPEASVLTLTAVDAVYEPPPRLS
nr:metallophosphoesterase [Propionicicella superfundia]